MEPMYEIPTPVGPIVLAEMCPWEDREARCDDCWRNGCHLTDAGREVLKFIRDQLTPSSKGGWE